MTDQPETEETLPAPEPGGTDSYLGGGITRTEQEMSTYHEPPGVGGVGGTHREDPDAEPPGIAPTGTGVPGVGSHAPPKES